MPFARPGIAALRRQAPLTRRGGQDPDWRRRLRRKIGWLLLAKLAALTILWALFFSPSHRVPATPDRVGQRLAVGNPPP